MNVQQFSKGDEKGYFEPGGSTVIILVKDNAVKLDDDILDVLEIELLAENDEIVEVECLDDMLQYIKTV